MFVAAVLILAAAYFPSSEKTRQRSGKIVVWTAAQDDQSWHATWNPPVLFFISEEVMISPLSIPLGKQGSGGNPSEPGPQHGWT